MLGRCKRALARAAPATSKKITGTRETGDRMRRFMLVLRIMPPTRHARGSDIIFDLPMVPPLRGSTMGYDYTALRAQNSTHSVRLNRPIDYNLRCLSNEADA